MSSKGLWFACLLMCFGSACSDGDDDSGATGGASQGTGGSTLAPNCAARCESKASSCGAPASVAESECGKVCAMNVTAEQLECLETSPCDELMAAWSSGAYPCGIGGGATGGTGGSGTGGSTSGGSGGGTSAGALGDSCDCPDDGDWVKCSGTDGPCESSLVCVEYDGKKICTQTCTPDSCGAGLTCTTLAPQGVAMGDYCW